jgi:GDPmannose 4,6-dehydratase
MPKAVICGISGQDGAYLAKLLLDKGYLVYGTSRDVQMSSFGNLARLGIRDKVEYESMSINDFRSVFQILRKIKPDEVYNLAGQSSVGLSFEQPVETLESISVGTLNLLEAIRFTDLPIRFYNACSGECFGSTTEEGATEDTPFRPRSPYAVAKAAAFWEVANYREAYNLYACSGLLFNHESPLRPERFVTRKIIAAACRIARGSNEKLQLGNINIRRDWGWAPEYVEAMHQMLQQDQPSDFVIATGKSYALQDFVRVTFEKLGLDWQEHTMTNPALLRPTDHFMGLGNPGKARRELGWVAQWHMPAVVEMMIEAEMDAVSRNNSLVPAGQGAN